MTEESFWAWLYYGCEWKEDAAYSNNRWEGKVYIVYFEDMKKK